MILKKKQISTTSTILVIIYQVLAIWILMIHQPPDWSTGASTIVPKITPTKCLLMCQKKEEKSKSRSLLLIRKKKLKRKKVEQKHIRSNKHSRRSRSKVKSYCWPDGTRYPKGSIQVVKRTYPTTELLWWQSAFQFETSLPLKIVAFNVRSVHSHASYPTKGLDAKWKAIEALSENQHPGFIKSKSNLKDVQKVKESRGPNKIFLISCQF